MPIGFDLALSALLGASIGGTFLIVWKLFTPASARKSAIKRTRPLQTAYWLIFVPLLMGSIAVSTYFKPRIHAWFATPIVATLPEGQMLAGKWWIDPDGTGHVKISNGSLTCSEAYDGRNTDAFVDTSGKCSDGQSYHLRVIRYGTANRKNFGEGVWQNNDRYGWYVFGWKARLAILTHGWLGLPWRQASDQDFAAITG